MSKVALITGINGMDGAVLAHLLLEKGYEVHGIVRRASTSQTLVRLDNIKDRLQIHTGDLLDQACLNDIMNEVRPTEVYNLGAQSFVPASWTQPELTAQITGLGVLRVLEAIRQIPANRRPRMYQASSSEMFGKVQEEPQRETTRFYPRSPYGCAKAFGHYMSVNYRESYDMFVCCGILFNHEHETRGHEFVTRKITHHVARQALGLTTEPLELGNLDSKRDWGHAEDYMRAAWLMLQQDKPDDFVIATGKTRTVREFVEAAYKAIKFLLEWEGKGVNERALLAMRFGTGFTSEEAIEASDRGIHHFHQGSGGHPLVVVNPKFFRPAEVWTLTGDASKARENLGWQPRHSFTDLVTSMVEHDLEALR